MLVLIGLGLGNDQDITLKGLEWVQRADIVFLEAYTAILPNCSAQELSVRYGKSVVLADRDMVESGEVLNDVETKTIALLVVGDPFGATTHSDLVVRCNEKGVKVEVVHNASIINAVGACGLQLYRYGQVLSLCFWTESWHPDSWYERLYQNRVLGVHTLLLLDIKVKEISDENLARGRKIFEPPRFMKISQAIDQLLAVEAEKKKGAVTSSTIGIGVARLGSESQQIIAGPLSALREVDFGLPLHSLIVAGEIHECEMDHVSLFLLKNKDAVGSHKEDFVELLNKNKFVPV